MQPAGSAEITASRADGSGLRLEASGAFEPGIGRIGFVLVDLEQELASSVIGSKVVDYSGALPDRVREEWTSAALTPGTSYRAFFHVYDRTGVNLVAYDRRDFTWQ
jgi:hypothetical protein